MKVASIPPSNFSSFTGEAGELGIAAAPEGTSLRSLAVHSVVTTSAFVIGQLLVKGFEYTFLRDREKGVPVSDSSHVQSDFYVPTAAAARGLSRDAALWAEDLERKEAARRAAKKPEAEAEAEAEAEEA